MINAIEEIRRIKQEGNIGLSNLSEMFGIDLDINETEEIIYGNPSLDVWEATAMLRKLKESIQKEKDVLKKKIDSRSKELAMLESRYEKLCDIDLDIQTKED